VLNALSGHQMLASRLETGEWQLQGNELVIKVAASATVIDMTLGPDAKKLIVAAASGVLKHAAKLKVLPGAVPQTAASGPRPTVSAPSGSARSRVEQDPLVQRMKEKFGAEIRTIIDYREKR
jgi:DNA polymerase-3 subunit gamma/tau